MTLFYRDVFVLLLGVTCAIHAFGCQHIEALPYFESAQENFSAQESQLELLFERESSESIQDEKPIFIVSNNPLIRNLKLYTSEKRIEKITPLKLLFGGKVWIKPPFKDTLVFGQQLLPFWSRSHHLYVGQ